MGIKLPTDEPCFPIQVNSILPMEGKSPNENEHDVDSNEQDKDISISDAETVK